VLSAEDVQAVGDAYGQERAYLAKCQHLILKTAREWSALQATSGAASCRAYLLQDLVAAQSPLLCSRNVTAGTVTEAAARAGAKLLCL
jgi:hypothetical protein